MTSRENPGRNGKGITRKNLYFQGIRGGVTNAFASTHKIKVVLCDEPTAAWLMRRKLDLFADPLRHG